MGEAGAGAAQASWDLVPEPAREEEEEEEEEAVASGGVCISREEGGC